MNFKETDFNSQIEEDLPVLLALAELVEASQPDKQEFFINDRELRACLLRLNSTDGWALIWEEDNERTAGGEYDGVNASVALLTEGRTRRVFLHSLFDHPHTACSCFKGMAFYIKEVDGIGLMDRSFRGAASYGWGWDDVANAAVGMQSSEFAPFGTDYLKSGKFL